MDNKLSILGAQTIMLGAEGNLCPQESMRADEQACAANLRARQNWPSQGEQMALDPTQRHSAH
eukprot:1139625-Pelagomonas_calceolata.AAC.3